MNKKTIVSAGLTLLLAATQASASSHHVRGHVSHKGNYVAPHRQTNPDHSKLNNWSAKGNVNPYTGKKGSVDPAKRRENKYKE
jgi:hypothetical protein